MYNSIVEPVYKSFDQYVLEKQDEAIKENQERNLEKMKRIKIEERNFFNKSILKELKYKKNFFSEFKNT